MATVSVRGSGTAAAQPDEVTVGLGVETLRPSAAEAFAEAARLVTEVVSLCEELGVAAGSRTTSRVSLAEHGEHTDAGWQHRGYRATSRIAVRLGDAELAGRLVSDAAERLGTRIDGPSWRVSHDHPARADARRRAAEDARSRAEEYAAALGGRIGAIVSIAEPGTAPQGPEPQVLALRAEVASMPLETGEQEVVAEVDVTFQLEQG